MADKGIIFSAPMVRALLAGTKTQTRRLLKPQPETFLVDGEECEVSAVHVEGEAVPRVATGLCLTGQKLAYAKGDRLYVRESALYWIRSSDNQRDKVAAFKADGYELEAGERWTPSIHMPRKFSRLWLSVTDVRVQRLQAITLGDICAEGLASSIYDFKPVQRGFEAWETLWNSLHTADGERWQDNPFVVAVSFDVHRSNIDAEGKGA